MPIFLAVAIGSFLNLGCSFNNRPSNKSIKIPLSVEIPQKEMSISLKLDDTLHGRINLKREKSNLKTELLGGNFFLPVQVPDEIILTLSHIPDPSIADGGVRAFIKYEESEAELPLSSIKLVPDLTPERSSALNLEFRVHGFKNIFPAHESRTVSVRIEIRGKKENELNVLKFLLSTPPSRIDVKSLTPEEFSEISNNHENLSFAEIKLMDKRFVLLRVMQVSSLEENPVEIIIEQRGVGFIQTKIYDRSYRDLGCDFAVDEQRLSIENSGPFEWIPINKEFLQFTMDRVHLGEGFQKELTWQIEPKTNVFIGLYGSDSNTLTLFDQGRPQDTIKTNRLGTTCHKECIRFEDSCVEPPDRKYPTSFDQEIKEYPLVKAQFHPAFCRKKCAEEKTVRDVGDVLIGRQYEGFKFIVSPQGLNFKAQASKTDSVIVVEQRLIPFLSHFKLKGIGRFR